MTMDTYFLYLSGMESSSPLNPICDSVSKIQLHEMNKFAVVKFLCLILYYFIIILVILVFLINFY